MSKQEESSTGATAAHRHWRFIASALVMVSAAALGLFLAGPGQLLDTTGFTPRWTCGVWEEPLGWLHIVADIGIFGAYVSIPVVLLMFCYRRRDVP